jgi:hypothetical protein
MTLSGYPPAGEDIAVADRSGQHAVVGLRRVLQRRNLADAPDPGLSREPHRLLDLLGRAAGMPVQRLLPGNQLQRAEFDLVRRDPDGDVLTGTAEILGDHPAVPGNPAWLEKYGAAIDGRFGSAAKFAERFSVLVRIHLTRVRGF